MEKDHVKKAVIDQFGKNAEKYVQSKSHANTGELNQIVQWLQPNKEWTALDIATGGGHVAKILSPHVAHVFSTDLTMEMLANTASHLKEGFKNIWYVLADAESLPFLDNTFEAVTCRIAPHHFPNPNLFINEVERVLKPGGFFLLVDNIVPENKELAGFMNTVEKLRDKSHVRCLSMNEWKSLFMEAGLVEVNSQSRKKTYDFPVWVERTSENQKQVKEVQDFILNAEKELQQYFHISYKGDQIQSLQVDEWMVLCKKGN